MKKKIPLPGILGTASKVLNFGTGELQTISFGF